MYSCAHNNLIFTSYKSNFRLHGKILTEIKFNKDRSFHYLQQGASLADSSTGKFKIVSDTIYLSFYTPWPGSISNYIEFQTQSWMPMKAGGLLTERPVGLLIQGRNRLYLILSERKILKKATPIPQTDAKDYFLIAYP